MKARFVFIEYGNKDVYFNELKYALMTLKRHCDLTSSDVYVYSESVDRYAELPVTAVSIKEDLQAYSLEGRYHFRIKPMVIGLALKTLPADTCLVFLDTDTYVRSSLSQRLAEIQSKRILMNAFEKRNPYLGDVLNNLLLPSGLAYSYDPSVSVMFNSGVMCVLSEHRSIFLDAVAILDGMLHAGFTAHTIEQCAVSEAFRIHGVEIQEVKKEVVHYWRSTDKKYMHQQLSRHFADTASVKGLPDFSIPHNWFLARWHKLMGLN